MKKTIKSVLICLLTFVNMAVIAQDEILQSKKTIFLESVPGFCRGIRGFGDMEGQWRYKRFVGGYPSRDSVCKQ